MQVISNNSIPDFLKNLKENDTKYHFRHVMTLNSQICIRKIVA